MKKILFTVTAFLSVFCNSQTFVQAYQNRANLVTQTNINTNLTEFASYGVKRTGTVANTNAMNWLKTKYLSYGYTDTQIVEDPFTAGSTSSKNLVVTKTGTLYPNTYVIICGHYDTVSGPGVNDNGSGVSIILEIARILKDVPTEYSIKFINFSGEEQGLYGSQHYVDNVANATNPKMDIKVVFNIDQVGGVAGEINDTVRCDVDYYAPSFNNAASQQMANQLAQCTTLYSPLQTSFYGAFSSDYEPFHKDGYTVTGFYEYNESNHPHTNSDTYANMDPVYVYNIAKAAVGAAQHFAGASQVLLAVADCTPEKMIQSLKISPNPTSDFINIEMLNTNLKDYTFTIRDLSGKLLIETENAKKIDISKLSPGIYLGTMVVEDQKITKKIVISK